MMKAGVHDMPEAEYHADPSLSSSGARLLLKAPALFRYRQDHPVHSDAFDFGTVAHKMVLHNGPEVEVIEADDWKLKATREQRDAARAEGKVPILAKDYAKAQAMAAEVHNHAEAGPLLSSGAAERSLFWQDGHTGLQRRARLDWMSEGDGFVTVVDYKTTRSASPGGIAKSVHEYGYHQQHDWYVDGVKALLSPEVEFKFIFQEKEPPYLVTVVQLDEPAVEWGHILNRKAIDIYQRCLMADDWPGYADKTLTISLHGYAQGQYERAFERGDYHVSEVPF